MKTPAERGPVGAWAYEARQDADLSVEEVQERLTRSGHVVTTATLRGVESGSKQPSRRLLRALATVYGKPTPNGEEPVPPADTAALVTALAAQTEAITALVRELQLSRAAQIEATSVALEALGALGSRQDPPGTQPDSERGAPAGTGR